MATKTQRVVVAGGGFAGVKAALELSKQPNLDVTLISDKASFEYHAALYRTSTGRSVLEVALPLADIFGSKPVTLIQNKVTAIDSAKQTLTTADGWTYHYDTAIMALGSVTSYFGIKGLAEFSFSLKSVDDATRLRNHLHHALVSGQADLNYVIVGAGPSGVELAGELTTYLKKIRHGHKIDRPFSVSLVEAAPRVLPSLPEGVSHKVAKRLTNLGISIHTNTAVKAETADQLQLPEGNIKTHTVIWTAGVTGNPFFGENPKVFKLAKGNRVEVDAHLQAAPNVYVLGDSAATEQSGWAQTALYDANFIARKLSGKPATYHPHNPIAAVPVGDRWCIVAGRRRIYSGYPGWIVRRWLDWQLYSSIMPLPMAIRSWAYGSKRAETCPTCR